MMKCLLIGLCFIVASGSVFAESSVRGPDVFDRAIKRHQSNVDYIYQHFSEQATPVKGTIEGEVVFQVILDNHGWINEIDVLENTTGNKKLAQSLRYYIKKNINFGPLKQSGFQRTELRLEFPMDIATETNTNNTSE